LHVGIIMFFRPNVSTCLSLDQVVTRTGVILCMGDDLIFVKSVTEMRRMQKCLGLECSIDHTEVH
jgi:hypothetical protein